MSKRMLIDARHSEETRVTIVKGSRVEEFDYESASRRQLKGNIYLARVTRVEPSLQAAFVEYGGNRHGFLAFSEIHPDYYQIPIEDREAMMAEIESSDSGDDYDDEDISTGANPEDDEPSVEDAAEENTDTDGDEDADSTTAETATGDGEDVSEDEDEDAPNAAEAKEARRAARNRTRYLKALKRRYSIQEVIKKRQVLLIQVVKEERGNKGAALTTYLSLAGRYCVLMPNSTHSGGISRKISSASDRKRLKNVINGLGVPSEMGLIIRTAGTQRTKAEIKRDYEYLVRLWNDIRELTLSSVAPALIYEEADLIKRTIRDLYARDIDEVLVEGEGGYRSAKDFMKLLMPSHAKKVQHYKDRIPLFHRYQVESALETMYQPVVQLKSGGYVVINPTEALISIDVNSGRSTKEHNIEETAYKTNLEAAEEVARQLRLRDMAGLVVIDFIDMEERSNIRNVEKRMKEVLKSDRARIQVGRISSFGLMELSRQRLRPNLLETSMEPCSHCQGTGYVKSVEFAALSILRQLEEEGIRARSSLVRVIVNPDVAVYLLNKKRGLLIELEENYNFTIEVVARADMSQSDIQVERENAPQNDTAGQPAPATVRLESVEEERAPRPSVAAEEDEDDRPRRKRRRRRRRRGERGRDEMTTEAAEQDTDTDSESPAVETDADDADHTDEREERGERASRGRRRRGRRGGRRAREAAERAEGAETRGDVADVDQPSEIRTDSEMGDRTIEDQAAADAQTAETATDAAEAPAQDKPKRTRRRRKTETAAPEGEEAAVSPTPEATDTAEEAPKRRRVRRKKADETPASTATEEPSETAAAEATEAAPVGEPVAGEEEKPKRAPRRRRTTKKDATPEAAAEAAAKGTADDEQAEAPAANAEAPAKPKRTRRKAAPKDEADKPAAKKTTTRRTTKAAKEAEEGEAGVEKPKRAPRKRKTAAEKAAEEAVKAAAAPDAAAAPSAAREVPAPTAAPAAAPVVTAETGPAAPAAPSPQTAETTTEEDNRPKRKGWWQRTFG